MLDEIHLEKTMERLTKQGITDDHVEYIDNKITHVLQSATNHAEGLKRTVPFSQQKLKRLAATSHWKMKLKQSKKQHVKIPLMSKKQDTAEICDE